MAIWRTIRDYVVERPARAYLVLFTLAKSGPLVQYRAWAARAKEQGRLHPIYVLLAWLAMILFIWLPYHYNFVF